MKRLLVMLFMVGCAWQAGVYAAEDCVGVSSGTDVTRQLFINQLAGKVDKDDKDRLSGVTTVFAKQNGDQAPDFYAEFFPQSKQDVRASAEREYSKLHSQLKPYRFKSYLAAFTSGLLAVSGMLTHYMSAVRSGQQSYTLGESGVLGGMSAATVSCFMYQLFQWFAPARVKVSKTRKREFQRVMRFCDAFEDEESKISLNGGDSFCYKLKPGAKLSLPRFGDFVGDTGSVMFVKCKPCDNRSVKKTSAETGLDLSKEERIGYSTFAIQCMSENLDKFLKNGSGKAPDLNTLEAALATYKNGGANDIYNDREATRLEVLIGQCKERRAKDPVTLEISSPSSEEAERKKRNLTIAGLRVKGSLEVLQDWKKGKCGADVVTSEFMGRVEEELAYYRGFSDHDKEAADKLQILIDEWKKKQNPAVSSSSSSSTDSSSPSKTTSSGSKGPYRTSIIFAGQRQLSLPVFGLDF